MNVKTIALSILSVLSLSAPAMAQSAMPLEWVESVGVQVVVANDCPSNMAGAFIPERKLFVVCEGILNDTALLNETVYHEAFHVLQWYFGENLNKFASNNCTPMSLESNDGYAGESNYTQDQRKEYEWAARMCEDDYELMDEIFYNLGNPI